MVYSILHSFWELLAPEPVRTPTPDPVTYEFQEYDVIVAVNEAGEKIILHTPKKHTLSRYL